MLARIPDYEQKESGMGLLEVLISAAIMALSSSALFLSLIHYNHAENVLSALVTQQQTNQRALWTQQLTPNQAVETTTATISVNGTSEPVVIAAVSATGSSYDAASTEYQSLP